MWFHIHLCGFIGNASIEIEDSGTKEDARRTSGTYSNPNELDYLISTTLGGNPGSGAATMQDKITGRDKPDPLYNRHIGRTNVATSYTNEGRQRQGE